jgi:protein-disulfide isomerase
MPPAPTRRTLLAALAAAPLVAATKPAPRLSARVAETGVGGFLIGKADAKLRLVEYFSFTCGGCGQFAAGGDPALKTGYVDRGLVAFEYRNLIRDPLDMTAALLARAGGATGFPGHYRALMLGQGQWLVRASKLPEAVQAKWYEGEMPARLARIARDSGLDTLMRARGMTAAQIAAALNSEVAQTAVTAMTNLARAARVTSTPGFVLNDVRLEEVHDWPALKTRLDAALRGQ